MVVNNIILGDVSQIVLDMCGLQSTEPARITNANLYVVCSHLTLEALFEGENRCVNSIIEF